VQKTVGRYISTQNVDSIEATENELGGNVYSSSPRVTNYRGKVDVKNEYEALKLEIASLSEELNGEA
jgi:hypothetical protein